MFLLKKEKQISCLVSLPPPIFFFFFFFVFIVEKNHIVFVYSFTFKTIKIPSKLLVALT